MTVSGLEIANFTNTAKTAMNFQNLTGTVGITGLNVHNNNVLHNVMVTNNTGTANITFTSPIIQNAGGAGNPDGLQVNSYAAGTVLNVTSNTGTYNNVPGNGVMFQANSGSSMTGILSGGTATLTNGLLMQETGTGTSFNFTVTGLTAVTTHNLGSNAITVGKGNGTGTFTGTVTNNVITSATCGGGCAGIKVASFGASGSSTVNVTAINRCGEPPGHTVGQAHRRTHAAHVNRAQPPVSSHRGEPRTLAGPQTPSVHGGQVPTVVRCRPAE